MKKILFILSFILLGVTSGYSQLDVASQEKTQSETILKVRGRTILLEYHKETIGYYLFMDTDATIDESVLFSLGKTADSAIKTLQDMIGLIDNHVANTTTRQGGHRPISLSNYDFNKNYLYIKQDLNIGSTMISKKELEKCIKAIKEHAKITD